MFSEKRCVIRHSEWCLLCGISSIFPSFSILIATIPGPSRQIDLSVHSPTLSSFFLIHRWFLSFTFTSLVLNSWFILQLLFLLLILCPLTTHLAHWTSTFLYDLWLRLLLLAQQIHWPSPFRDPISVTKPSEPHSLLLCPFQQWCHERGEGEH